MPGKYGDHHGGQEDVENLSNWHAASVASAGHYWFPWQFPWSNEPLLPGMGEEVSLSRCPLCMSFSSRFLLKRDHYLMHQQQLNHKKEHTCKAFSSRARWLSSNLWMRVCIVVLLGISDFLRSSRSIMKMPCSRSDSNTLNDYKSWLMKDSTS